MPVTDWPQGIIKLIMTGPKSDEYIITRIRPPSRRRKARLRRIVLALGIAEVLLLGALGLAIFGSAAGRADAGQQVSDAPPMLPSATPSLLPTAAPSPADTPTDTPAPTDLPTSTPVETPTPTDAPSPTPESTVVRIMIVGDVMLGRMVNSRSEDAGDLTWPFYEVADILRSADLTLGNLEAPFATECEVDVDGMLLCAPPEAVAALVAAGFDGVSLANNHSRDYGQRGFEETIQFLTAAGITPFYEDVVLIREVRGVRIGVMAYDNTLRNQDLSTLQSITTALAEQVDIVVGLMHWGAEYWVDPTVDQEIFGRGLIRAGMDVVAGAHPHYVQRIDIYQDRPVFYSLGNFVFDQMWSDATSFSVIADVQVTVLRGEVTAVDYDLIPIRIRNFGQPSVITAGWELRHFCEIYPLEAVCPTGQ